MRIPFDEINPSNHEHIGWVKQQRDPELWHAVVTAIVNSYGTDPIGFLPWVFTQPETDRSTAGYFFIGLAGPSYLQTGIYPHKGGECLSEDAFLVAIKTLLQRCTAGSFEQDNIGLPVSDEHRLACLESFEKGEARDEYRAMRNLFDRPFPPTKSIPYDVEDGVVYN